MKKEVLHEMHSETCRESITKTSVLRDKGDILREYSTWAHSAKIFEERPGDQSKQTCFNKKQKEFKNF